jgi:hypothetical protein
LPTSGSIQSRQKVVASVAVALSIIEKGDLPPGICSKEITEFRREGTMWRERALKVVLIVLA